MSLFADLSPEDPDVARAFEGPASYAHIPGHAAYGTTSWYIHTWLDDYRLGPFDTQEEAEFAGAYAAGIEAVLAIDPNGRTRWKR